MNRPQAGPCLSEEQLVAFVEGRADLASSPALELHLDHCLPCFEWVARMMRASFVDNRTLLDDTVAVEDLPLPAALAPLALQPNDTIGRYRIVARLGEGSMGVVYRARDPVLERDVALKLIRSARPTEGSRARALREAQALAKLRHPNVVTVHDLGFVGDQVFVAMELVEGVTLAAWVRRERRSWRRIRDRFVEAGRGLAAAHAAGLVHGDFKPQNVLVSDERAVVTDFGLVRSVDVDEAADGLRKQAGTPAYMAPEQFEGGRVDARSDLFNFCAAMYEAVFGQPAFEGDRFEERRAAVAAGRLRRPPPEARAPGWLRATLLRGLERDPARRIGSMEALLHALDRDRRRRRHVLAVAGVLVVVAIGTLSAAVASYRSPLTQCRFRASGVTPLGSPAAAERLRQAFLRTGVTDAAATAETVARILRRYGDAWSAAYAGACEATYRRGAQSLEGFELRIGCLEQRHAELAKLVSLFESADGGVVERAVRAASELEPVTSCTNTLSLRGTLPPPRGARATIEAVRATLAEVRSLELVGKYDAADQLVDGALGRARALGYPPLEAEAWLRKGFVSRYRGQRADSERAFRAAFDAAERGGADRTRARAAIELVDVAGHREAKVADGDEWAERADAILVRLGRPVDDEAALAMNRGLLDKTEGKLAEAQAQLSRAYELRKQTLPPDSPLIPLSLANLATVADERGDYDQAEPMYRQAVARMKALLGPTHPDTLLVQGNLAGIAYSLGHYHDAKRQWEEVLARETERLGPLHPDVARTLYNIADAEACVGDYADAITHAQGALSTVLAVAPEDLLVPKIELSLAIYWSAEAQPDKARPLALDALERRKAKLGANDPSVGGAERQLARLDLDIHRPLDARAHAERALALLEHAWGENDSRVADVLDVLGTAERELGRAEAALARHERALAIRTALDPSSSALPDTLTDIGLAELALGDLGDARDRLERAEALRKTVEADPAARATTAFALARSLERPDRARARALAESALTGFVASGPRFAREAQQVRVWLKQTHR